MLSDVYPPEDEPFLQSRTGYFSDFLGRPGGRRVLSRPHSRAICRTHASRPKGQPRRAHRRRAASSCSVCGRFTSFSQSAGRPHQSARQNGGAEAGRAHQCADDHRHRSADRASPARTGFRSTYRRTDSTASPPSSTPRRRAAAGTRVGWTAKLLYRPCHTCPLLPYRR